MDVSWAQMIGVILCCYVSYHRLQGDNQCTTYGEQQISDDFDYATQLND